MYKVLTRNQIEINQIINQLDKLENMILAGEPSLDVIDKLVDVKSEADLFLKRQISYQEHKTLLKVVERVNYLILLAIEVIVANNIVDLENQLKTEVSKEQWEVYIKWESIRARINITHFNNLTQPNLSAINTLKKILQNNTNLRGLEMNDQLIKCQPK